MNIETRFNIGSIFFMPRSRETVVEEKITVDNVEYTRQVKNFVPYVKKRKVDQIDILVTGNDGEVHIKYKMSTWNPAGCDGLPGHWDTQFLGDWFNESQLKQYWRFDTEEQAMEFATEYAIGQKKAFYGF